MFMSSENFAALSDEDKQRAHDAALYAAARRACEEAARFHNRKKRQAEAIKITDAMIEAVTPQIKIVVEAYLFAMLRGEPVN